MPNKKQRELSRVLTSLLDREYPLAVVIYVVLCIPAYFWLEGPVGTAGTVVGSVVIAAMITGSLLLVPLLAWFLRNRFGIGVPENIERVENGAFRDSFNTLSQEEGDP